MSRFARWTIAAALAGGVAVAIAAIVIARWLHSPGPPQVESDAEPPATAARAGSIVLHDATAETGIAFHHTDGSSGKRYIVETVASGLATFDYDGDGWIDIYFINGRPLPGAPPDPAAKNRLYRNRGNFHFEDVTEKARVADAGYGLGVAIGDYDNDGRPDIYVSNFGPKKLYRNNGDGTFSDVSDAAGVTDGNKVGAGAAFLDIDGDGNLDLYVANYLDFDFKKYVPKVINGLHVYPGPLEFNPVQDVLFRNNGDGTFADITRQAGIEGHLGTGMGMVCADYDNDGDTDIFVLSDVMPNLLFENDGTGHFAERGLPAGFAYDGSGQVKGSMGVDCADYDNDGRLDLFVTSYAADYPALLKNLGGRFEDVTLRTGAAEGSFQHVKWGCGLVDFDNDGFRDIFMGCGHLLDNAELAEPGAVYKTTNLLLRNMGNGKFVNVSDQCGLSAMGKHTARGVAFDDLDNDGAADMVIVNSREPPTVLRNMYYALGGKNHWLQIELRGVKTNRDAVGARVKVVAGDLVQIDEKHSGRGYQSHFGSRLHFGLGKHSRADRIEVHWIGGGVEVLENVPVDRRLVIREGMSQTRAGEGFH